MLTDALHDSRPCSLQQPPPLSAELRTFMGNVYCILDKLDGSRGTPVNPDEPNPAVLIVKNADIVLDEKHPLRKRSMYQVCHSTAAIRCTASYCFIGMCNCPSVHCISCCAACLLALLAPTFRVACGLYLWVGPFKYSPFLTHWKSHLNLIKHRNC